MASVPEAQKCKASKIVSSCGALNFKYPVTCETLNSQVSPQIHVDIKQNVFDLKEVQRQSRRRWRTPCSSFRGSGLMRPLRKGRLFMPEERTKWWRGRGRGRGRSGTILRNFLHKSEFLKLNHFDCFAKCQKVEATYSWFIEMEDLQP